MKPLDIIVCIDNKNAEMLLTVGKLYVVLSSAEATNIRYNGVTIIDDTNERYTFFANRFSIYNSEFSRFLYE